MKKFKSAFTMTEVLICIFTVGIVITFSLSALRSVENSYTAVTYFVERNINAAIEYIKREKEIGEPGKSSQFMCFDTTLGTLRKYHTMPPDEVLDTTPTGGNAKVPSYSDPTDIGIIVLAESNPNPDGVFTFCEALADVYSTKGEIKCNLDDVFDVSGDDRVDIEKLSGKKDFKKAPNFTLTNGQRFYISKRQAPSSSDKYGYRLIAVDLNGSSAPNITAKIGSKASDVVVFKVYDDGMWYPLHEAADNLNIDATGTKKVSYLNARVYGYLREDEYNALSVDDKSFCKEIKVRGTEDVDYSGKRYECIIHRGSGAYTEPTIMKYREAYCKANKIDADLIYKRGGENYCNGYTVSSICSSGTCEVTPVKPAFRYSFN